MVIIYEVSSSREQSSGGGGQWTLLPGATLSGVATLQPAEITSFQISNLGVETIR